MLNKIEFKGNENVLYAVVIEHDGVPQGSYMYKNHGSAAQKFEEMKQHLGPTHGLILYVVDLRWTVLSEIQPEHTEWDTYNQHRHKRSDGWDDQ